MENRIKFGLYVKERRLENKQTIEDVSELSGISTSQISRIEKAQRGIPKPEMLEKLARGLHLPYEELMEKAGYLKNVPSDELEAVKDFFENHRKVDEKIEISLKRLSTDGNFGIKNINEIEKIIEKYADEEKVSTEELNYNLHEVVDFINSLDLQLLQKIELLEDLNELAISMNNDVENDAVHIEIDQLDKYLFSKSGIVLDQDTQSQLKAVLRAVLKL